MMPTTWWFLAFVCAVSAVPWIIASRKAKVAVILRRRFIKELFGGPQDEVPTLSAPERKLLMLVGRVISTRSHLLLQVPLIGIAAASELAPLAFFMIGFALLMGVRWFLLLNAVSAVPTDAERYALTASRNATNAPFLVEVDVSRFRQFGPDRAPQFWSLQESRQWLMRFGFRPANSGKWVASSTQLALLETSEFNILNNSAYGR